MPLFWATFNPLNLQSSIILWLASIANSCFESTTLGFRYFKAAINLVIVAIFFHKIYKDIFIHLLKMTCLKWGLVVAAFLSPSQYILELLRSIVGACCTSIVWCGSKKCLVFLIFTKKIVHENGFKTQLLSFLDQVIRCELILVNINQVFLAKLDYLVHSFDAYLKKWNNITNILKG